MYNFLFLKIKKNILILLSIFIFFIFNTCDTASVDWQGHRGARGILPENSIPGFLKAIELGVNTIELDVVISGDNKVIVSHEPFFSRSICFNPLGQEITQEEEKQYNIYRLTAEEIRAFDCGSVTNSDFPYQKKLKVYKPLLSEVFEAVQKYCKETHKKEPYYNIELKSSSLTDHFFHPTPSIFSDIVHQEIQKYVDTDKINIQSFDFRILQYFHKKYPDIRLAVLIGGTENLQTIIDSLGFQPDIYSCYYTTIKKEQVTWLHSKGIKVIPWTVNDTKDMIQLLGMKVDGIITDYPDKIIQKY